MYIKKYKKQPSTQFPKKYHKICRIKLCESEWARFLGISRNKFIWWAKKMGADWVLVNLDLIKKTRRGMSDHEYMNLGLPLPAKKNR